METYKALNPRGESESTEKAMGLNPRLNEKDLSKMTLGLFAGFKRHWLSVVEETGKQLQERYPGLKVKSFWYPEDMNSYNPVADIGKDDRHWDNFKKFLDGCDAVIAGSGDGGSCTLQLTFCSSYVEKLGKPLVIMVQNEFEGVLKTAADFRGIPAIRYVVHDIPDLAYLDKVDKPIYLQNVLPQKVAAVLDDVVDRLTAPLTPEETEPKKKQELPRILIEGSLEEVNKFFYQRYLSYGMPIIPPTEEAVNRMMEGTDLPPDHVVGLIPPKRSKATVEKIAINAVMAGCLPTHMPVLIAAIEAVLSPNLWMEAFTVSAASWAPMYIVNGPVRNDIDISCKVGVLSPYNRANAAIANAMGLMVMNLGGVRRGFEDRGVFGHEGHFGIMIGENEEESPWEPWHQTRGFDKNDSTVTVMFPNSRELLLLDMDPTHILRTVCERAHYMGFDPGCTFLICPEAAQTLTDGGYSKQSFLEYVVEYARRPAREINSQWMIDNNHLMPGMVLPATPDVTVKKFFSDRHLLPIVTGMSYGNAICMYGGGGDHGQPVSAKVQLPRNWSKLVEQYKDYVHFEESDIW